MYQDGVQTNPNLQHSRAPPKNRASGTLPRAVSQKPGQRLDRDFHPDIYVRSAWHTPLPNRIVLFGQILCHIFRWLLRWKTNSTILLARPNNNRRVPASSAVRSLLAIANIPKPSLVHTVGKWPRRWAFLDPVQHGHADVQQRKRGG